VTELNKENIGRLINRLEATPDVNFDMGEWTAEAACGTVACIAGHAALMRLADEQEPGLKVIQAHIYKGDYHVSSVSSYAAEWMGLAQHVASELFVPISVYAIKKAEAITMLEWLQGLDHMPERSDVANQWWATRKKETEHAQG